MLLCPLPAEMRLASFVTQLVYCTSLVRTTHRYFTVATPVTRSSLALSMLLAFLSAAALLADTPRDTTKKITIASSPTVSRTPVVGVSGVLYADSIVVEKGLRTLTLYSNGFRVKTYFVALGKQPVGDKQRIGDNRTPEGVYRIDAKNPQSKFHKALHISYPDASHIARANALGVAPGGDIMIHGLPRQFADLGQEHRTYDWTEGCIAVTNAEIEEIWRAIPMGAVIEIRP
jgi:murein L,D-transpeptidase YafK